MRTGTDFTPATPSGQLMGMSLKTSGQLWSCSASKTPLPGLAQAARQGAEQQELAIGLVGVAVAQAIARQDEGVFRLDPVTCKTLGVLGADTALLGGKLEGVLRRGVLELLECRGVALTVDLVATEELDVGPLGVISALGRNTDGGITRRIPDKIAAIVGIAGEQPRLVIDEVGGD